MYGWPPSHRNPEEPQPEVCDLCGLVVGATHLMLTDVEGLRGAYVCDVMPFCSQARSSVSYRDRRRFNAREHAPTGEARRHPQGAPQWWDPTGDGS